MNYMNVRMRADYFEIFENGSYRPLYFNFVYDLHTRLATQLIEYGMAEALEVNNKTTDNKEKVKPDVHKPKRRPAKSKESRAGDGSGNTAPKCERVKKRSKN